MKDEEGEELRRGEGIPFTFGRFRDKRYIANVEKEGTALISQHSFFDTIR